MSKEITIPDELKNTAVFFGGSKSIQNIIYETINRKYLSRDIREKEDYNSYAESVIDSIRTEKDRVLIHVLDIFQGYKEARKDFARLEKQNRKIQIILDFVLKPYALNEPQLIPIQHCAHRRQFLVQQHTHINA